MSIIETEVRTGETRRVGNYEITPTNQVLKIMIPGNHGGIIWNRPKSVTVVSDDGQEQILPVADVTRIAIWAMLAGGFLGAIIMSLLFRKNNHD